MMGSIGPCIASKNDGFMTNTKRHISQVHPACRRESPLPLPLPPTCCCQHIRELLWPERGDAAQHAVSEEIRHPLRRLPGLQHRQAHHDGAEIVGAQRRQAGLWRAGGRGSRGGGG